MMYVTLIIDYIHHLMNECKIWFFAYNSDRRVYEIKQSVSNVCEILDIIRRAFW